MFLHCSISHCQTNFDNPNQSFAARIRCERGGDWAKCSTCVVSFWRSYCQTSHQHYIILFLVLSMSVCSSINMQQPVFGCGENCQGAMVVKWPRVCGRSLYKLRLVWTHPKGFRHALSSANQRVICLPTIMAAHILWCLQMLVRWPLSSLEKGRETTKTRLYCKTRKMFSRK